MSKLVGRAERVCPRSRRGLSRRDAPIVAWHEVPLDFGHLQKGTSGDLCPEGRRGSVPEGRHDRSLAQSAWKSAPRKHRPVGYGTIDAANPRGISRQKMCAMFLKEG
jgi:hypothetical protein